MKILKKGIEAVKSTVIAMIEKPVITENDKGEKITEMVETRMVKCQHATAHNILGKGERYQLTWNVDLSELTEDERDIAAAEHFLIKIRRPLAKDEKPESANWDEMTFNAKEYTSRRLSKVAKAARTIADFTDEQLAELGLVRAPSAPEFDEENNEEMEIVETPAKKKGKKKAK